MLLADTISRDSWKRSEDGQEIAGAALRHGRQRNLSLAAQDTESARGGFQLLDNNLNWDFARMRSELAQHQGRGVSNVILVAYVLSTVRQIIIENWPKGQVFGAFCSDCY